MSPELKDLYAKLGELYLNIEILNNQAIQIKQQIAKLIQQSEVKDGSTIQ